MTAVFSTSWYLLKAKYDAEKYKEWIDNMLQNVRNYYLVLYTDEHSRFFVTEYDNHPRIRIVNREIEEFTQYKHKDNWIANHDSNTEINEITDWQVNMLWSEKIHFVDHTIRHIRDYFPTLESVDWYGWCDIGYFRPTYDNLKPEQLLNWPNPERLAELDPTKIHYALVNKVEYAVNNIRRMVETKNEYGLPKTPLPINQVSVGGGFFLLKKENMEWWRTTFDDMLALYFRHKYLVKDDQMVIATCVFSNPDRFYLHFENNMWYDLWFAFQRILA
jgi:hypothetical protein